MITRLVFWMGLLVIVTGIVCPYPKIGRPHSILIHQER